MVHRGKTDEASDAEYRPFSPHLLTMTRTKDAQTVSKGLSPQSLASEKTEVADYWTLRLWRPPMPRAGVMIAQEASSKLCLLSTRVRPPLETC